MRDIEDKICLIIPCFNEEHRLRLEQFDRFHENVYFAFVNDGSTDGTYELLQRSLPQNSFLVNLERNSGKAEAVRQGMLAVSRFKIFEELTWIGYWDADLATPLQELRTFLRYEKQMDEKVSAIYGSRIYKLGSTINRSYKRHVFGRIFATIISVVFGLKSYDTQCGAKLFRKELVPTLFGKPFVSRWIFDIEILLRLKEGTLAIECPLRNWTDVKGSKIQVGRDSFAVIREIYRIWKAYGGSTT